MYRRLPTKEKIRLIKRVQAGEPVVKVCREAKISRTIFYRWLKKYKKAAPRAKKRVLVSKVVKGKKHWKRLSVKIERKVLKTALDNPSFSPQKISQIIGVSGHGVWNVLKRNGLNTQPDREGYIKQYGPSLIKPPAVDEKITMIRRFEEGDKIAYICREFGISRTAFYKWLKRYQEAPEEKKREVLQSWRPKDEEHWRFVPVAKELVLEIVIEQPELSSQKISQRLPLRKGKPILGSHGVYNLLKRLNLNTYEKRLAYAEIQAPVITPVVGLPARIERLIGKIPVISAIPPPARARIASAFPPFLFSLLSSVFLSTIFIYWLRMLSQAPTLGAKLGLLFASTSLLIGGFFFAYSMKYYLTLAIVLSFSRQPLNQNEFGSGQALEGRGGFAIGLNGRLNNNRRNNNKGNWLQRIFGIANGKKVDAAHLRQDFGGQAGGLQPSLDHIKLKRYPFVSIHLPFYNEKKVAERILSACTSMDYPNYEIVVCDDSTDETTTIVKRFARRWNDQIANSKFQTNSKHKIQNLKPVIKILHRPTRQGFKGGALAYALKHMNPKTEFVVVFDADFIPYPDTLELFIKYFKANNPAPDSAGPGHSEDYTKSNVACVAGYQWHVLNKSENWITRGVRTEYSGSYVIERPGQEILGAMKLIHGSVYCARADLLKKIGWGTSITEDFELTLKLYEQGYKVVYTPYVQAPAECVSTIKRLIRQRMRWAEGHSHCVKRMFLKLLSSPKMSLTEKLELLYLSPYYLQAFFFLVGTFSWLLAETVFRARLPFWTSLWGWSLVLTNFFSLPLMNGVGLFLEESEERDYVGILSFIFLSYILVPFQAYASVKGFLEKEEGPWFRTPKTGLITDIFTRGRFYRWISGILPGRFAPAMRMSADRSRLTLNPYVALATSNTQFNQFKIPRRRIRWLGRMILVILLIFSLNIVYFVPSIPIKPSPVQAVSGTIAKGKLDEVKKEEKPEILSASVDPDSVRPGDIMTVKVKAKDSQGIKEVTADMGGVETIKLSLVEGTEKEGEWLAEWKVYNTESKWYETIILVASFSELVATTSIKWKDPTTYTWDGSDSTDWFTGANWDQNAVPGDTDDVVINGNYTNAPTINAADTIGSLAIGQNNASVLTFSNNITLTVGGNVTVYANGTITHTANSTTETHKLTITAANIDIQTSGKIDVSGKGYTEGYGGSGGSTARSGGSHGGNGGDYLGSSGNTYGSYSQPVNIGSGGGTNVTGGNGGGAIKFDITGGTVTVSGSILADGTTGSACDSGGGAGGSIWLIADTITGAGTISAKGGDAGQQSGCHSAGGGGGRIAIKYTAGNYNFTGTLTAYGGLKMGGGENGGAGTIYKESSTQSSGGGDLIIDNNNYDNYWDTAEISAGTYQFDSITLNKKGHLVFQSLTTLTLNGDETGDGTDSELRVLGGTLNFPSSYILNGYALCLHNSTTNSGLTTLAIGSTGTLTHYPNGTTETHKINLTLTGGLTINSGGKINVDARGYQKNYGGSGGSSGRSGGSYGGNGGDYVGTSGNTYGSYSQPVNIGGGSGGGPSGAGAVKIDASGATIDVSGSITANGGVGGVDQGGGAGGSIWLIANTITGSTGSITANGGTTAINAAGGGGGRIAIEYTAGNYNYTGTLTAYGAAMGGTGENGGAGTIYKKSSTQTYGDLIVDNNNLSTDTFDIAEIEAGTYQFDSVTLNKKGHLKFKATSSVNIGASSISGDGTDAELTVLGTATFSSSYTISGWVWSIDNGTTVSGLTTLTISSNGGMTHTQNFTTETHKINLTLSGGLTINSGGKINVNGRGYQPGYGGSGGSTGRSGGSYGGNGGDYLGTSGNTYGSYSQPSNIGGGGGGSGSYGGGAIKIDASGATIDVSGTISANGTTGGYDNGAGAGGSIWLIANTINGSTGSIAANGSNAISVNSSGGGGGRIAIGYTTGNYNYTGTLTAYGGAGAGSGANESGGAGTIYKKSSTQTGGDLIINNNNLTTTGDTAEIESGTYTLDSIALNSKGNLTFKATTSLTMASGATFSGDSTAQLTLNGSISLPASFTFTGFDTVMTGSISGSTSSINVNDLVEFNGTATSGISSVTINSGGILRHTANSTTETYKINITVSSFFTINSGGSIALTGRGFTEGSGTGAGSGSSGGGHGGVGGNGNTGSGGGTYDTPSAPANIGSGAGTDNSGGAGGGYVKIDATGGTVTVNTGGEIRADGSNGATDAAGGGAGGSIYIITSTLGGCGTLSAKGGNGTTNGGGGGGD